MTNKSTNIDANITTPKTNDVILLWTHSLKCGCSFYQPKDYRPLSVKIPCMEHTVI